MKGKFLVGVLVAVFCYLGAFALCVKAFSKEVAVGAEVSLLKVVVDALELSEIRCNPLGA